ncbi:MAG: putative membrane protein [Flavobacterium sp.]|jgi:uncharacterized membrane protein
MASQEQEENWNNGSNNWLFLGIYYNKEDKRIFVPKRIKWMGITINFGNQKSFFVLLAIAAFFSFILFMIVNKTN